MGSPLVLAWCICVSPPSHFLLTQKKKRDCGTMEGLLSFLSFGVASSQLKQVKPDTSNSIWMFLTVWTCKTRNISNIMREKKTPKWITELYDLLTCRFILTMKIGPVLSSQQVWISNLFLVLKAQWKRLPWSNTPAILKRWACNWEGCAWLQVTKRQWGCC